MRRWLTFILIFGLLGQSSHGLSERSAKDIDQAIGQAADRSCSGLNKIRGQIEDAYLILGSYEEALKKAKAEKPYVEILKEVRDTAAVVTSLAALVAAYGIYRGHIHHEGQYAFVFTTATRFLGTVGATMAGIVMAGAQAGYTLTNDEIIEFTRQVKRTRETIDDLRKYMVTCK